MDPQALARRHVAAAGNVFRSTARQLDRADRYFARYGSVYSTRPSEQVRGLFERWSIKFSADYYEAKDREEDRNGPRVG